MAKVFSSLKECLENPEKIIPLRFDKCFKEVVANPKEKEIISYLMSIKEDIPYEKIYPDLILKEREEFGRRMKDKDQVRDITLFLDFDVIVQWNIELNGMEYKKQFIYDRNTLFLCSLASHGLQRGEDYTKIRKSGQWNISTERKSKKIMDTYQIQNRKGEVFSEVIKIDIWYIYKMWEIWYSGLIKKYDEKTKEKIRIGALLMSEDIKDFRKILREMKAPKEIKEKLERKVMYKKNQEKFWVRTYSQKEEEERMRKSFISDARNEGMKDGLRQGMRQGRTEERYELISKMASENIPVSMIAKVTNMKVQDIHRVIRS